MDTISFIFAAILFTPLIISAIVSIYENEIKAAKKLFLLSIILPLPFLLIWTFDFNFQEEIATALIFSSLIFLFLLIIPIGRNPNINFSIPFSRIDERDTMFSRNELMPGSENFINYYQNNRQ